MKILTICNQLRVALKHSALALAVGIGLGLGSADALTTTTTIDLGTSPANTFFASAGSGGLMVKIPLGSLPAGSILRSVTATNLKVEIDGGDAWASELCVYLDPTPGTPGTDGLLTVGDSSDFGGNISNTGWGAGQNLGPFSATRTAPANFPDTIDLNTVAVMVGCGYANNTGYSGTITIEYDVVGQAVIAAFEVLGIPGTIDQNAQTIALTVPYGTDITSLMPTFTLSSGACDKDNGGPTAYDFTAPVVYTVTDGAIVKPYTVTVSVTPASSAKDILTFGIPNYPAVISGTNITWNLPIGTNLTTLAPDYTVSQFATGSPLPLAAPDFATTNPQTYTITAEDGSTKPYSVMVNLVAATGIINVSYEAGSIPPASSLVGPAGGSGETWNQPTSFSGTGLSDSAGIFASVGWSNTDMNGIDNWGNPGLTMLRSGMRNFAKGAPQQFVINGLTSGTYYKVWIASQQPNGEQAKGDWSTPNPTSTVGSQPIDATIAQNTSDWKQGNNYVFFDHVLVNGSGEIVLNGLSAAGYRLPVNGFQLVPTTAPPVTDYGTWASGYLPTDVSVPTADTDGDGLTNQQEYAFGLNPTSGASVSPITAPLNQTTGMFSYTRRATPAITGLTYTVLTSTDLVTWTPDAGAVAESVVTAGEVQTVTFTVSNPAVNGQLFVRVKASQ